MTEENIQEYKNKIMMCKSDQEVIKVIDEYDKYLKEASEEFY